MVFFVSIYTQGEVLGFFDGAREIWDAMGYTEDDLDDDDDDDDGESCFISHAERAAVAGCGFENSTGVCQDQLRTGGISGRFMSCMLWLGCVRTDEEDAECDDPSRRMRRSIRCRKPPFWSHLYAKSDRFTKTGS